MYIVVTVLNFLGWAIFGVTAVVALLLVLRVIAGLSSYNYYGWLQFNLRKITEPMVRPIRSEFGGRTAKYDLMPLVMAVMVFLTGLFVADMIWQLGGIYVDFVRTMFHGTPRLFFVLSIVVRLAGWLYIVALLLRFFMPWFGIGYRNPLLRFVYAITEPLLRPLRRVLSFGMVDISWMIAVLLVQILTSFLANVFINLGA